MADMNINEGRKGITTYLYGSRGRTSRNSAGRCSQDELWSQKLAAWRRSFVKYFTRRHGHPPTDLQIKHAIQEGTIGRDAQRLRDGNERKVIVKCGLAPTDDGRSVSSVLQDWLDSQPVKNGLCTIDTHSTTPESLAVARRSRILRGVSQKILWDIKSGNTSRKDGMKALGIDGDEEMLNFLMDVWHATDGWYGPEEI